MSKVVKKLIARDISSKLDGVSDAIVANIVGMTGNENYNIRKTLREQGISLLVVKRSLAAMATEGTSLRPAFDDQTGSLAVIWGCEDFVSLVKSVKKLADSGAFPKLEFKGGVMDGEAMSGEQVKKVAKWPNRREQISLLVGQILSPGSNLAGQLVGPASTIAGQVKKMIEDLEDGDASPASDAGDASPAIEG